MRNDPIKISTEHILLSRRSSYLYCLIALIVILLLSPSTSFALEDFTLLAPKRYDKFMGGPTEYYDMFSRCYPSDTALLSVRNGNTEDQRITSAVIYVNGVEIMSENDFGQQVPYLEVYLEIQEVNELKVVLKSGLLDGSDGYNTSFLEIEVVGTECDVDPPYISDPIPFDSAIINDATPQISVKYDDNTAGAGVDIYATRIIVDGYDVTEGASISNVDFSYTPISELPEGNHKISVTISDLAFNRSSFTWNFRTDTIPPVVKITSRPDNQFINTPIISLSGESDDSTATVTVNKNEARNGGGKFSFSSLQLYEGENLVLVHSKDFAGNFGEDSFVVTLDTIPPRIEITSHADDGYLNTPVIELSGRVNEPVLVSKLNGLNLKINNGFFTFSGLSLTEGPNSVNINAIDRAGNLGTNNISINLDTIPPEVGITSQIDNVYLNTPLISIAGTLNEPVLAVLVKDNNASVIDGGYNLDNFELTEGANTILVTATDRAGNVGTKNIVINLDTVPPEVGITSQTENVYLNTPVISVSGTLNEPVLSVTVNGNTATVTDRFYRFDNIVLAEGANKIVVEATDRAGNIGSKTITVNLDTVSPIVDITSHVDNVYLNTPQIALAGTINEPELSVSVNGLAASLTENRYHLPALDLAEGFNKITVNATDRAGNVGTNVININLDTIKPEISISSHETEDYVNTPLAKFSGIFNEPVLDVTVNGNSATTREGAYSFDTLGLTEGANTILVAATDRAGNVGMKSIVVNLDTVSPIVNVTSQTDGMYLNTPVISIAGTLSEPTPGVSVNGNKANVTDKGYSLDKLNLTEGTNTVTVSATDRAGNVGTNNIMINLDTVLPIINITSYVENAYLNTPVIPVSGVFNEAVLEVTVNGAPATIKNGQYGGGLYSFEELDLTEGSNSIIVAATDLAGNRGNKILTINLDTIPPKPNITSQVDGIYLNTPVITVEGKLNELESGVTVNKIAATVTDDIFISAGHDLKEGANTITVVATDRAGNVGTETVNVILDTTPPVLAVSYPPNNIYLNKKYLTVSGTVTELHLLDVLINKLTAKITDKNFSFENVTLSEGTNTLQIKAEDRAKNVMTSSLIVNLDTVIPKIVINSPDAGSIVNQVKTVVSGRLSEPVTSVTVNGLLAKTKGLQFTLDRFTLKEGANTIDVLATDLAGSIGSVSISLSLDTVPPRAPKLSPLTTPTNVASIVISGSAEAQTTVLIFSEHDDGSKKLEGKTRAGVDGAFNISGVLLKEGFNNFTAGAKDGAGNISDLSPSVSSVLDTAAPVITVTSPNNKLSTFDQTIRISGSVNEKAVVTINGNAVKMMDLNFNYPVTLSSQINIVTISATDTVGNMSSVKRIVRKKTLKKRNK